MKKKLMNKRYVKVCAYLQNVFYGKKSVLIANILSTSNQAAATKASAPVVETRASLALKALGYNRRNRNNWLYHCLSK